MVESLLKGKKYAIPLAPLAIIHPFFAAGVVVTYLFSGRFQPSNSAETLTEPEQVQLLAQHYAEGEEHVASRQKGSEQGLP